jgi:type I restriction-modification system DNA methylase subunit
MTNKSNKLTNYTFSTEFQTPEWCCDLMSSMIPDNVIKVLEPTPGLGNLVTAIKNRGFEVESPLNFEDVSGKFDAIVMNPPFTPMKRGYEILYKAMNMTNNIIALMPWLSIINSEKRTKIIMEYGT